MRHLIDHGIRVRAGLILAAPSAWSDADRAWLQGRAYDLAVEDDDKERIKAIEALRK